MRAIFDGTLYNTDDVEDNTEVMRVSSGHFRNDYNFSCRTLYRTPLNHFFLHCEGGAGSIYAERDGNTTSWGESIQPLNKSEALEFITLEAEKGNEQAVDALIAWMKDTHNPIGRP